jgi:hypothetical protein
MRVTETSRPTLYQCMALLLRLRPRSAACVQPRLGAVHERYIVLHSLHRQPKGPGDPRCWNLRLAVPARRVPVSEAVGGGSGYSHRLLEHVRGDAVRWALVASVSGLPTPSGARTHPRDGKNLDRVLGLGIHVTGAKAVTLCDSVSRSPLTVA